MPGFVLGKYGFGDEESEFDEALHKAEFSPLSPRLGEADLHAWILQFCFFFLLSLRASRGLAPAGGAMAPPPRNHFRGVPRGAFRSFRAFARNPGAMAPGLHFPKNTNAASRPRLNFLLYLLSQVGWGKVDILAEIYLACFECVTGNRVVLGA